MNLFEQSGLQRHETGTLNVHPPILRPGSPAFNYSRLAPAQFGRHEALDLVIRIHSALGVELLEPPRWMAASLARPYTCGPELPSDRWMEW